jgi:hypothetical protein
VGQVIYCRLLKRAVLTLAVFSAGGLRLLAATAATADELVKQHLQSLGSADARAVKSRLVEGRTLFRSLVGSSGQIEGKLVLVSEARKSHFLLKINANDYHGEQFICDGQHSSVAGTNANKSRSDFGEVVRTQDIILREGLIGGVLSTAWPLLDIAGRKASLSYEGLKKIDGRELQVIRYRSHKSSDLQIFLYFDPEVSRHVLTIYELAIRPSMATETLNPRQEQNRYRIEERFNDFKSVDGLTLPSKYDLRFTEELQNGFTQSLEWDITTTRIENNISLDPRNFQF